MFGYDQPMAQLSLKGYAVAGDEKFTEREKRNIYLAEAVKCADIEDDTREQVTNYFLSRYRSSIGGTDEKETVSAFLGKKYKPVALKVKPVYTELPEQFRIRREIKETL